jgi:hypothetical protein
MRAPLILLLLLGLLASAPAADAVAGKVIKVLPLLLDLKGRAALSPSLFDRDAYQLKLHEQTNEVSTIRYDVQWSAKNSDGQKLKLRLELRGVTAANLPKLKTLETEVAAGKYSQWTSLALDGDEFKTFAAITAWRATLWDGETLLGEQKSFLW